MDFEELKTAVGFPAYYAEEARYAAAPPARQPGEAVSAYFCDACELLKNASARWFNSSGVRSSFRVAIVQV